MVAGESRDGARREVAHDDSSQALSRQGFVGSFIVRNRTGKHRSRTSECFVPGKQHAALVWHETLGWESGGSARSECLCGEARHETLIQREPLGCGIPSLGIATHYDLLGVPATASADEIRDAYRARARVHHPDQAGPNGSGTSMAAINEAYRVLRDPTTRSRYDADLRLGRSAVGVSTTTRPRTTRPPMFTPHPMDTTPAHYPWKLVAAMAAVGACVVLIGAALYEPAEPARLDNLLGVGSCVEIESNNDVREASCDGANDLVVHTIVDFDQACPTGLSAHRDRQGMGIACIARSRSQP